MKNKKPQTLEFTAFFSSKRQDLNLRPLRPERSALPNWATLRTVEPVEKLCFLDCKSYFISLCGICQLLFYIFSCDQIIDETDVCVEQDRDNSEGDCCRHGGDLLSFWWLYHTKKEKKRGDFQTNCTKSGWMTDRMADHMTDDWTNDRMNDRMYDVRSVSQMLSYNSCGENRSMPAFLPECRWWCADSYRSWVC